MTIARAFSAALFLLVGCGPVPMTEEPVTPELSRQSMHRAADAITLTVPDSVADWGPEISVAAERHGVPADLVAVVVWLESNGQPDAVSPAGALGLMQLMPATAAAVAGRRGDDAPSREQLLDPRLNLDLGTAHLAELADELATEGFDDDAVHRIAIAYNGGHGVLEAWQRGEPLPAQTERYASAMRRHWQSRP